MERPTSRRWVSIAGAWVALAVTACGSRSMLSAGGSETVDASSPAVGVVDHAGARAAPVALFYEKLISEHESNEASVGYAYALRMILSVLEFLVGGGVYGTGMAAYAHVDIGSTTPATWLHVVAVFDGTSESLYLNGVRANRVTYGRPLAPNAQPRLRGQAGCGGYPGGAMSDLRLYDCALDDAESAALFATPATCP